MTRSRGDAQGRRFAGDSGLAWACCGLMDVARGEELLVLLGEGYMPAQEFHVELGPEDGWWNYTKVSS